MATCQPESARFPGLQHRLDRLRSRRPGQATCGHEEPSQIDLARARHPAATPARWLRLRSPSPNMSPQAGIASRNHRVQTHRLTEGLTPPPPSTSHVSTVVTCMRRRSLMPLAPCPMQASEPSVLVLRTVRRHPVRVRVARVAHPPVSRARRQGRQELRVTFAARRCTC